jgi:hypothetical protein
LSGDTISSPETDELFPDRPPNLVFFPIFLPVLFLLSPFTECLFQGSFFNHPIPLDERLNKSMIGHKGASPPRTIELSYTPTDRARVLLVVFNFESLDGDYELLRLGNHPDLEPAWIEVRGG